MMKSEYLQLPSEENDSRQINASFSAIYHIDSTSIKTTDHMCNIPSMHLSVKQIITKRKDRLSFASLVHIVTFYYCSMLLYKTVTFVLSYYVNVVLKIWASTG
jgi:hypothetical protein